MTLRSARRAILSAEYISVKRFRSEIIAGLENVTLLGATKVGDAVGLEGVSTNDTIFEANPIPKTLAAPVRGLATGSTIKNSTFDVTSVGRGVQLSGVVARGTVIPAGIVLTDRTLGVPPAQVPPAVPKPLFDQIVPSEYIHRRVHLWRKTGITRLGEPPATCAIA